MSTTVRYASALKRKHTTRTQCPCTPPLIVRHLSLQPRANQRRRSLANQVVTNTLTIFVPFSAVIWQTRNLARHAAAIARSLAARNRIRTLGASSSALVLCARG